MTDNTNGTMNSKRYDCHDCVKRVGRGSGNNVEYSCLIFNQPYFLWKENKKKLEKIEEEGGRGLKENGGLHCWGYEGNHRSWLKTLDKIEEYCLRDGRDGRDNHYYTPPDLKIEKKRAIRNMKRAETIEAKKLFMEDMKKGKKGSKSEKNERKIGKNDKKDRVWRWDEL